ncbi:MAG TPA: hypothetical protein VK641_16135, partial [Terriglobales bacterium]|nr:hypothetical protein [Terriglobales bacterium]
RSGCKRNSAGVSPRASLAITSAINSTFPSIFASIFILVKGHGKAQNSEKSRHAPTPGQAGQSHGVTLSGRRGSCPFTIF